MFTRIAVFSIVLTSLVPSARAQTLERRETLVISRGWGAIAAGKPEEAVGIADELLERRPHSHVAMVLKISALAAGTTPIAALNAYEEWLKTVARNIEDRGLLEPAAVGLLRILSKDPDVRVQWTALAGLARAGDTDARAQLAKQSAAGRLGATAALAATGDAAGIAALQRFIESGGGRDNTAAVEVLMRQRAASPAVISALMADRVPLNRAAAARLIASSDHADAVQQLQKLETDPDQYVRTVTKLALAKAGAADAVAAAHAVLAGQVPDLQLLAAESLINTAPQAVDQAIRPLLANPDGLIRFQAAALLGRTDPASVRDVLLAGLGDENPLIREEAARVISEVLPTDVAELRRLLRQENRFVVATAAATLVGR